MIVGQIKYSLVILLSFFFLFKTNVRAEQFNEISSHSSAHTSEGLTKDSPKHFYKSSATIESSIRSNEQIEYAAKRPVFNKEIQFYHHLKYFQSLCNIGFLNFRKLLFTKVNFISIFLLNKVFLI